MPIPWTKDLSVEVEELDKQHKTFLSILNELYVVLKKDETRSELEKNLNRLISFTDYHFATEEKYFDKFNYPLTEEHKKQHRDLKTRVLDFQRRFELEGSDILYDLLDFLEDWTVYHLKRHDRKYIDFFNEKGLN